MRKCLVMIVAMLTLLSYAAPLLAQEAVKPGPPPPASPLLNYFIALVLVAVVGAGALKGAKRSHQD